MKNVSWYAKSCVNAVFLIASISASVMTQTVLAATAAPAAVMKALDAGSPQNVIVLFEAETVAQEAATMRTAANSQFDPNEILGHRADRYRN